ncbi:MAG: hypothetical protein ACNYPI_10325 [Arenicellales bacterium WSBS_2016_MAG_OTU3]
MTGVFGVSSQCHVGDRIGDRIGDGYSAGHRHPAADHTRDTGAQNPAHRMNKTAITLRHPVSCAAREGLQQLPDFV